MKIKLNYNVKSSKRNYFSAADLSKFRLANKLIKRGNISAKDVNKLLNFSNIKIGQDQLDKLINKPRLIFFDLSRDTMKTPEFLQSLGTYRSKIQDSEKDDF
jgi:Ca2+-binding EF-hand superfamily protein